MEGGKQGASLKKLKKDKVVGATGKAVRIETNTVPAAPRVKSELTLPAMYCSESLVRISCFSYVFLITFCDFSLGYIGIY